MARLVPDASATLTWCFEDEAMPWTDALLADLRAGGEAIVPAHWPAEVANALLIAVRRGRISRETANRFFLDLRALPIRVDPESSERVATVTAFVTVGFSFDDEPTVNSQDELAVATSGPQNLRRRSVPT